MRYRVQVVGWTLIWLGVFTFLYLGWQLYVTDWLNAGAQAEAAVELEETLSDVEPEVETIDRDQFLFEEQPPPGIPDRVTFIPEEPAERGESFAFLTVPRLGIESLVIYEGVDRETLKAGPGHMVGSSLPGQPGNAVLSGHRTTYGRPFFDFDLLEPGDRVEIQSASGVHVYEVRETAVVAPTDVWVVGERSGGWLTLTTCHPKFSARQRLVVWAELVEGPNLDYIRLHQAKFDQV